jgi:hypothetical protein
MRAWTAVLLAAGLASAQEPLLVRVLPQPLATNRPPSRLGLEVGFLEGPGNPLAAECLSAETLVAEKGVAVRESGDPNTGARIYWVSNAGEAAAGITLGTTALRRGVGYTVRVRCRREKGDSDLLFRLAPAQEETREGAEMAASVKGEGFVETAFEVTPWRDGAFRCAFRLEPGAELAFAGFSMRPDDAVEGWDGQAIEALRALSPGVLRWPVERGVGFYNWYHGVGPRARRRAVSPSAGPSGGHDFGTVEFVRLCRLVAAEPLVRVALALPGCEAAGAETPEAAAQLAADWVAYCNAPSNQPLAALRARHGQAGPLNVRRWELAVPEGVRPDAAAFGEACRATAAAMRAADPAIVIGLCLAAGEGVLRSNALARAGGLLSYVDTPLTGVRDRYVADVLARLETCGADEQAYFAGWYGLLTLMNGALKRTRAGAGDICTPVRPEQALRRAAYAKRMPTEAGSLLALYNRFPAAVPLAVEGVPADEAAPFQVAAAWAEGRSLLVVYVYNSGAEARAIRLDLTALKRRFAVWASEQLAGEIAARRETKSLPVTRRQKAGAALSQTVMVECPPASFTRVVVKE